MRAAVKSTYIQLLPPNEALGNICFDFVKD